MNEDPNDDVVPPTACAVNCASLPKNLQPSAAIGRTAEMNGVSAKAKPARKGSKAYCLCREPDDGSPMIHCSSCKDWCAPRTAHTRVSY